MGAHAGVLEDHGDVAAGLLVLHGVDGEDGAVAGLLVMTGVPFVGSPVRAGALAADKWATKLVAEAVARFREMGLTQVRLDTAYANDPARSLFRACGFRQSIVEMLVEL